MAFLVDTYDKPGTHDLRLKLRPAHLEHLKNNVPAEILLAAGPKLLDDGKTSFGSFLILNVKTREEAQAIIDADPYTKGGLFEKVVISRWFRAILDGKFYV